MARDDAGLILRALAARGNDQRPSANVFVLGGFHESRLNLHAQQRRALNLVWALDRRDRLRNRTIAVVGAGVGGTTFAVAAADRGAQVWLIDEHEEPITTQRASVERFLDPNLFGVSGRLSGRRG
jgi:NADPH-dependent 2,4-dienoyl-CoA reductase/sulfur reductase-like enzyme